MLEGLDELEEAEPAPALYGEDEEAQGQSWMDVQLAMTDAVGENAMDCAPQDVAMDCSPHTAPADGELMFFWLDMLEKNGTLYVIGKTPGGAGGELESCCVKVTGIERNVFLLPRAQGAEGERVAVQQVHQEFEGLALRHGVRRFMCKAVTRHYAFEAEVPATAEYLKVAYGFDQPALPAVLSGTTFERAFGTTYSAQELFLLKRRVMGPCWLTVRGARMMDAHSRQSWCRREFSVGDPKAVRVADDDAVERARLPRTPALTTLSLSLRTATNRGAAEIVAASVLVHRGAALDDPTPAAQRVGEQLTLVRALAGQPLPADFARAAAQQSRRGLRVEVAASE
ncbi:DNA-directed DNA polymerase alpha catalytic subunit pol1, partial [Coemansia guatemalensis]